VRASAQIIHVRIIREIRFGIILSLAFGQQAGGAVLFL